ncbi:MAG: prepilin-type N-terminal cleavage/methylation domain-containing protein [Gammaproteobacteria bacterium]|nr:prepilin-type N-terminal cleavage/methylation domain-containing protein [Gammaproteobacteria bacterium]
MLDPSDAFSGEQRGFSLVELLVGLAVGMIILAGAVTLFAKISFSGLENTRAIRLNQQMRATLDFIHRDLQRAGYVKAYDPANAASVASWDVVDADGNFTGRAAMAATIGQFGAITIGANCIAYRYDLDKDGALDGGGAESFGFRLNGGAVQSGTNVDCAGAGNWEGISSGEVVITALTFTEDAADSILYEVVGDEVDGDGDNFADCGAGETCLHRRKIIVVLSGELTADSTVTVELRDSIKIKNDRFVDFNNI